mmetsp:Transcript_29129/g.36000  ORF Transcript_29129/g.36000 Transcript_29129/m.36000 type:complete len:232 (-) Transcript_29129:131-826(-)
MTASFPSPKEELSTDCCPNASPTMKTLLQSQKEHLLPADLRTTTMTLMKTSFQSRREVFLLTDYGPTPTFPMKTAFQSVTECSLSTGLRINPMPLMTSFQSQKECVLSNDYCPNVILLKKQTSQSPREHFLSTADHCGGNSPKILGLKRIFFQYKSHTLAVGNLFHSNTQVECHSQDRSCNHTNSCNLAHMSIPKVPGQPPSQEIGWLQYLTKTMSSFSRFSVALLFLLTL